jgi:hypothetical protein
MKSNRFLICILCLLVFLNIGCLSQNQNSSAKLSDSDVQLLSVKYNLLSPEPFANGENYCSVCKRDGNSNCIPARVISTVNIKLPNGYDSGAIHYYYIVDGIQDKDISGFDSGTQGEVRNAPVISSSQPDIRYKHELSVCFYLADPSQKVCKSTTLEAKCV